MGLRGPTAKPTAMKLAEGRYVAPSNEVCYESGIPDRPAGMTKSGAKVWDQLVTSMASSGVLKAVHSSALAQLAEDMAELEQLRRGRARLLTAMRRAAKEKLAEKLESYQANKRNVPHEPRLSDFLPGGAEVAFAQTTEGKRLDSTMRSLGQQIISQRREFGLTPASSARVIVDDVPMSSAAATSPMSYDPLEAAIQ